MTASTTDLFDEVTALRETVSMLRSALAARLQVMLRPVQGRPFLGQPLTLSVAVSEWGQGLSSSPQIPKEGIPVTLTTTWGRLQLAGAYNVSAGNSLTARTSADGTFQLLLLPPTSEDLLAPQQDALEVMLALLNPDAATPRDAEVGLHEIARQYRWEVNRDLRRAIDIYFRDFSHRLLDVVNERDEMSNWSYFNATVVAYVHAGSEIADGTPVQSMAALTLSFKDWLGPWLQTYQSVAETEASLQKDLQAMVPAAQDPGELLDGVYGRVNDYVRGERGLAGQHVGRTVAETSLRNLIDTGLAPLPLETRTAVFPALYATSSTIVQGGTSVVAAVGQARADLRQELNSKIRHLDVAGMNGRLDTLQQQVAIKADRATLDAALSAKVDATTFSTALAAKADAAAVGQALAGKVDAVKFEDFRVQVNDALRQRKVEIDVLNSAVATKVDSATFDRALATKADNTRLDQFQLEMRDAVRRKVEVDTFNSSMATKVDAATFNNAMAAKVDAATFNNALATKADTAALEQVQTNFGTQLQRVNRHLFGPINPPP